MPDTGMDAPLTEESARLAYRFILGREPESPDMLGFALSFGTIRRLREAFIDSVEFEAVLHRRPRVPPPDAPPLAVVWQAEDKAVLTMLAAAQLHRIADAPDAAALAAACLARAGLTAGPARFVFDGAALSRAEDLRFGMAAPFDLWISIGVLRHLPPPLAARVLARALALVRPGGAAVLQALTYGAGYAYHPDAPPDDGPGLHVLPQPALLAIAAEAGCRPWEMFDDLAVPPVALWRSTICVLHKPA